MEFVITRTSQWGKAQPHEKAVEKIKPKYHYYQGTEEEWNQRMLPNNQWRDRGTEHQVLEDGTIKRRLYDECVWVVKISTLEELLAFVKEVGSNLIISEFQDVYELEIYADYRDWETS